MKKQITNNLLEFRHRAGLLQSDVATALGVVSSDSISHWEKGRSMPRLVNLFKLAHLYGVSRATLYSDLFKATKPAEQLTP